jgi:hypothetical protein
MRRVANLTRPPPLLLAAGRLDAVLVLSLCDLIGIENGLPNYRLPPLKILHIRKVLQLLYLLRNCVRFECARKNFVPSSPTMSNRFSDTIWITAWEIQLERNPEGV